MNRASIPPKLIINRKHKHAKPSVKFDLIPLAIDISIPYES